MSYLDQHTAAATRTSQKQPLPGRSDMLPNSEGGYVWGVDKWTRLNRFLILGSEGGSYYIDERELTSQNVTCVRECLIEDGPRLVSILIETSVDGRAPKQDATIFALAMACASPDLKTRRKAFDAIPDICRIGTDLFMFARFVDGFRSWGRGLRNAVAKWYTEPHFDHKPRHNDGTEVEFSTEMDRHVWQLAFQLVKYQGRDGWTHNDVLRSAHASSDDPGVAKLLEWVAQPEGGSRKPVSEELPPIVVGWEAMKQAKDAKAATKLIRSYNLPRECVLSQYMTDLKVLEALLDGQPMGAMVRNLASMTRNGLLTTTSDATKLVIERLHDEQRISNSRIHPISVLAALKTYEGGVSPRGSGRWDPVASIVDALDDAFYASFGNVPKTGKSRCVALDVSASMTWSSIAGIPGLTPRIASAAMAMVTVRSGDAYEVLAFSHAGGGRGSMGIERIALSPRQRLDDVIRKIDTLYAGGTDASLPFAWATANKVAFDSFEIFTDNETHSGQQHVSEALNEYRQKAGRQARMAVVAMVSNGFTIADPNDAGQLDVVGFDTGTPEILSAFAKGEF